MVAFIGPKVMLLPLGVVELDVVHKALGEELVAGVHLYAKGLQHRGGVLGVFHYGVIPLLLFTAGSGKNRQIVVQKACVGREFHHLGVHEHKLELRRVLGVKQRCHNYVKAHGFTLLGGAGHKEVRGIGKVKDLHLLGNGVANSHGKFGLGVTERGVVEKSLQRHY